MADMDFLPSETQQQMSNRTFDSMDITDLEETLLTCGSLGTEDLTFASATTLEDSLITVRNLAPSAYDCSL